MRQVNCGGVIGRGRRFLAAGVVCVLAGGSASGQTVVYVDAAAPNGGDGSTWASAYQDLRDGLDAARAAPAVAEIRVAQGLYRPDRGTGDRGASFELVNGTTLRGGYAGVAGADPDARDLQRFATVLSGDLAGDDVGLAGSRADNSRHVVKVIGVASPTVLEGCVVVGGAADGAEADGLGGGLLIDGGRENVVVSHCRFLANRAVRGGGIYSMNAGPRVVQSIFAWNKASYGSGAVVEMTQRTLPEAIVANCTFANNLSEPDGYSGGYGEALYGYALEQGAPRVLVRQCVAGGNSSTRGFRYPAQYGGYVSYFRCHTVEASSGPPAGARIVGDPQFVDPDGRDNIAGTPDDDFRLQMGSICDDWGDAALAPADYSDIDRDGDRAEPCPLDAGLGPRRLPDPAAISVGVGMPPFIDLGAFEGPVLRAIVADPASTIPEGGSAEWMVTLSRPPQTSAVTVEVLIDGDPSITVAPTQLVFDSGNWSTAQTLTVSAAQDTNFVAAPADVVFSGEGLADVRVHVDGLDDDPPIGVVRVRPGAPATGSGASWDDAVPTLAAALQLADLFPEVQEIWLATGTYRATSTAGFVLNRGITIAGGFSGTETSADQRPRPLAGTIISGDVLGNDTVTFGNKGDNALTVFSISNGAVVLDGVSVTGASGVSGSSGAGSGLLLFRPTSVTLRECDFSQNLGRGVFVNELAGDIAVSGCRFSNNRSVCTSGPWARGGGMRIDTNPMPHAATFEDCVFESNHGVMGAGLAASLSRVSLRNVTFRDNAAEQIVGTGNCSTTIYGGGASITGADSLEMSSCVFENNRASGMGAGLYLTVAPSGFIRDCVFRQNDAGDNSGGGIYHEFISLNGNPARVDIEGCEFDLNSAGAGAAMADSSGLFRVTNCSVRGNTGGSSAVQTQNPISGCTFEDNVITSSGGALSTSRRVSNCTFRRNQAAEGGAITGSLTATEVVGCLFDHNTASAGDGGAIWYAKRVVDCVFIGNQASRNGGATYNCLAIANCRFIGNHAGGDGGAVWRPYTGGGISNSGFSLNSATNGGAIFAEMNADRMTICNCTLVENVATAVGGGIKTQLNNSDRRLNVVNSILWNNSDSSGVTESAQVAGLPLEFQPRATGSGSYAAWPALFGPADGGFPVPLPIQALEDPAAAPGRTVRIIPAPNWVQSIPGSLVVWVSTSASGLTDGGSMIVAHTGIDEPYPVNDATLTFTVACDDSIGEPGVPGLYLNGHPIPGTEGIGQPTSLTTIGSIDVMPFMRPRSVPQTILVYLRDSSGGSGLLYSASISIVTRPVSYCIVSGLSTFSGHGNISSDPRFVDLAGPDGIRGTEDDSFAVDRSSPALDAGDNYSIDGDAADADSDGVTFEVISVDLTGSPRRIDYPDQMSGRGQEPFVDIGAVETLPTASRTASCRADVTGDGQTSVQDLFVFLADWFADQWSADFNGNGAVSVQDIFDFLAAWFAGCP